MASSPKKIILKSIDGETFEVDKAVALQMQPINYPIEEDCADTFFPVPNVKGSILSKVIEYCKMHADEHVSDDQLKSFDAQFVNVEQEVLFDLILEYSEWKRAKIKRGFHNEHKKHRQIYQLRQNPDLGFCRGAKT